MTKKEGGDVEGTEERVQEVVKGEEVMHVSHSHPQSKYIPFSEMW